MLAKIKSIDIRGWSGDIEGNLFTHKYYDFLLFL